MNIQENAALQGTTMNDSSQFKDSIQDSSEFSERDETSFDYSYVDTIARIAIYDDLKSAPRIIEVKPATTAEYIESLTSTIYEQSKLSGGSLPYTVIREVSENLIHAQFTEIIVSIFDQGNTIRFSDQGPGITNKEKAKLPGFTSAVEPMKKYIRGVGSGLPIVKEYLEISQGTITIDDNLDSGAVVTISLKQHKQKKPLTQSNPLTPPLTIREKEILPLFLHEGALGVTDIVNLTGFPQSSTHTTLVQLEQYGLIEKTVGQKRLLTDFGYEVANSL